jgi:hypothetical protein
VVSAVRLLQYGDPYAKAAQRHRCSGYERDAAPPPTLRRTG